LPSRHTAIIQRQSAPHRRQSSRIIEGIFSKTAPVDDKLRQIDFATFIADCCVTASADRYRPFHDAPPPLLPEAFRATETSGLMTFITADHPQVQSIRSSSACRGTLRAVRGRGAA